MNDDYIIYGTTSNPNPYGRDAPEFTDKQIELATSDAYDELHGDSVLMGKLISEGEDWDLKHSEIELDQDNLRWIGNILSHILTCKHDDLDEHVDDLKNALSRPLAKRAREMAIEQLTRDLNDD